jgi:hypothetical protein
MLKESPTVEQVGSGLPDRPAAPDPGRERGARDVLDVVLFVEHAFVGQGALPGIDVREGPPTRSPSTSTGMQ